MQKMRWYTRVWWNSRPIEPESWGKITSNWLPKKYLWKYSKVVEGEKIEIRESRILLEDSFRPPNDRLMVSEDPYGLDPNAFKEVNEVVVT